MLNEVVLQAHVPQFKTNEALKFFKGEENGKQAALYGTLAVRRNFKPKDAPHAEEDLIDIQVYGMTAENMYNHVGPGDEVIVRGELRTVPAREDKNGNTVPSHMIVIVNSFYFTKGTVAKKDNKTASAPAAAKPATKPTAATTTKAAGGTKKYNMFNKAKVTYNA